MVDFADSDFGGASFGGGYSDPSATGNQRSRDKYGAWGNYWAGPMEDNPYTVLVEAMRLGPAAAAPGHGPQLTGGIVGNPGQPLGMTPGGYVNSPFGEFGPQQGMGYTQNSPYGEFGPSQPGGYNMPGDIDGGGEYLRRKLRSLAYENAYQNVGGTSEGGGWI